MRILNADMLTGHGNVTGRRAMLEIMEAGMTASDPYQNTRSLVSLKGDTLRIGNAEYEAEGDPQHGIDEYDVRTFDHIWVVGAGKGAWRVAKALEDELGQSLSGGVVIGKYGDEAQLDVVEIVYGNHPTPDANCVRGCERILELAARVTERDLVFTIIANGGSSLLTLPCEGVRLEDVAELTAYMQIERGADTEHLNMLRNLVDRLKGGKLARAFSRARLVNIAVMDLSHVDARMPGDFRYFIEHNFWLHNMPMEASFAEARRILDMYGAWDHCPASIRRVLEGELPENDCVHYDEYRTYRQRMFGIMPTKASFYYRAVDCAREMGYNAFLMTENSNLEAAMFGEMIGCIAECTAKGNRSLPLPAALVFTGENRVTVGKHRGIGGRNQECALGCARRIQGLDKVVCAAMDTDGTDGPGGLEISGAPRCLAGAIVDGTTIDELKRAGYAPEDMLAGHDVSEALWNTGNGIEAVHGISLNDLIIVLVQE